MSTKRRLRVLGGILVCTATAIAGVSAVTLGACAGDACHVDVGTAIVECDGSCPSAARPNCYVRFRPEGSSDDWTETGDSTFDRTPDMEWSCYCGT